ncbi:MAG: glutaminyl-peptide cyclotransferase [Prevotella sp.]|nr:glutaminyl-peptide cyclotransferase [Prevotella sp.]
MKTLVKTMLAAVLLCCSCRSGQVVYYNCNIEQIIPHDEGSYTQGLFFHEGRLYESAGQYGESSMRLVDLATGDVLQRTDFDQAYFVEGSCILGGKLYILTWMEGVCFVCDPATFEETARLSNRHQGWGLTTDGTDLIMSDGSSWLFWMDPASFTEKKSVNVKLNGHPVPYLNELEYINGRIWANVYGKDQIVIINPKSGEVEGLVDCRQLRTTFRNTSRTDVLNGIAYNPQTKETYLTGKYWPSMFKITYTERD